VGVARSRASVHRRRRAVAAAAAAAVLALGAGAWLVLRPAAESEPPAAPPTPAPPVAAVPSRLALPQPPAPIPGYLLIADRGNNRMLLVDGRKRILWRYPTAGQRPSFPFRYDDDAFFTPGWGGIVSNQEDQQTIERISFPGGRVQWTYGHPNAAGSTTGYLNTPDDAYVLPNGSTSVADVTNCRVVYISATHRIVHQLGTTGVCAHDPPRTFAAPNGDTPLPGGGVLVTEITGSWVDAIAPSGKLMWSVHAPVAYPSDAQRLPGGRILLADYSSPGGVLIMNRSGRVLWRYGPVSGPGSLDHPSLALRLPNGLIAVNDDYNHRVVLIDPRSGRIVWQYGHDGAAGTAHDYLNTPDGMDFLPYRVATAHPAIAAALQRRAARPTRG
jgi:PQQ-like domain